MSQIKVGIVGIGRAGWGMHCQEIMKRADKFAIVAACDPEADRRQRMRETYGCATYRSVAGLVKDPQVELVSIASRSPDHVAHARKALAAGKYVFIEKPVALSMSQAKALARTAAEHPGRLFCRHNRRFEPTFQHIREIMAEGILGEVFEIKLRRNGYQRRGDWQTLIDCGGGQLNNWGPHIIDHALRLLESPVADQWSDLKKIAALGDAEDHLKIVLRGENGRVVDLEISGGAAIGEPQYIVLGNRGALTSDEKTITLKYLDPAQPLAELQANPGNPPMEGSFGNPEKLVWIEQNIPVAPATGCDTDHIWDHVYAAIREGRPFPVTLEEALAVVAVTCRVRRGTKFARIISCTKR